MSAKKIKLHVPQLKLKSTEPTNIDVVPAGRTTNSRGWGLSFDYHASLYKKETVSFQAQGIVKTADGKEIKMDREFYQEQNIHLRLGDAAKIDPLVINYAGNMPVLTGTKFIFDLDADGTPEQISRLQPGSGFLVLDKNSDGRINNGTELFGPVSGNGFSELALLDEDGNGWLDENDPVFDKLRIWSRSETGEEQLLALGEVGIGALYLGHVSTSFEMRDQNYELLAQLQKTGLFLREDGTAGTVQHIDLAV